MYEAGDPTQERRERSPRKAVRGVQTPTAAQQGGRGAGPTGAGERLREGMSFRVCDRLLSVSEQTGEYLGVIE